MKLLIVFTISLCLLCCRADTPDVSLDMRLDKLEAQSEELEQRIANLEERITLVELKMSISKANRIAMIEALNRNGYDGDGWAAEVDAFFDGLTDEQRKEFVKVPMEDFVDLLHSYGLTFPWERQ